MGIMKPELGNDSFNLYDLNGISKQILLELYKCMLKIRKFEERIVSLYNEQEMKTPVHLYIGQEAIAAGVCANLKKEDYIFSTHRSHGHYLAKGGNMKRLTAELYGRKTGCSRGKGGSMHVVDPESGICGSSAIVGGCIPLAVGTALASSLRKDGRISVSFFGDGAVDEGTFHESLNFASLKRLPVIFICENNFYATYSHQSKRQAHDHIFKLAEGYKIPGIRTNGNNVLEVYRAMHDAVERARSGQGSSLIECRTYRWKGHVGPDCDISTGYRTQEELDYWINMCPLKTFEGMILQGDITFQSNLEEIKKRIDKEIEEAFAFAQKSPFPAECELFEDLWG